MICAHCGAPIKYNRFAHGYLHEGPLGDLRVSRREAMDIKLDPPGRDFWKRRGTHLHPAEPQRRTV